MRERAVSSATKKNCRIAPSPDGTSLEAQCEQFDSGNPKDQDGKCHRIVFQPKTHHVPRFCDPSRPGQGRGARSQCRLHGNVGNRTRFQTLQKKFYGWRSRPFGFPSRVSVDSDAFGTLGWTLHVRSRGARIMRVVLGDLLLFFFLALFVTGILIAAASLLI